MQQRSAPSQNSPYVDWIETESPAAPVPRLSLVPKLSLSSDEAVRLGARLSLPRHRNDEGPPHVWNAPACQSMLLAVLLESTAIGAIYHGGPAYAHDVAWWLDSQYRGRGLGNAMVDALAPQLSAAGITGIGEIAIRGPYWKQSAALVRRLKRRFTNERDSGWFQRLRGRG